MTFQPMRKWWKRSWFFEYGQATLSEVRTWNKQAVRCYEKAGFVFDSDTCELETYAGKAMFSA